jgi:hypothetical protein
MRPRFVVLALEDPDLVIREITEVVEAARAAL